VSEEVEQQLADVLVCLGEEAAKIEVLSGALARMGVDAPGLLSDNGLGAFIDGGR
jgi:aspartokinase